MSQFTIVFRPHNVLNIETMFIGSFNGFDEAYEAMCELPALGHYVEPEGDCTTPNRGCKYIQEMMAPNVALAVANLAKKESKSFIDVVRNHTRQPSQTALEGEGEFI